MGLALTEAKRPKMDQRIKVCRLGQKDKLVGADGFIHSALAMRRECVLELHQCDPTSIQSRHIPCTIGAKLEWRRFIAGWFDTQPWRLDLPA